MDIASYSSDSRAVIKNAREVAAEMRHPEIDVEHLLIAVIRHEGSEVESILNQIDKSPGLIESIVEGYLKDQSRKSTPRENLAISPGVQAVLNQAIEEKAKLYDALVEPEHIFIAIFDPKSSLAPYVRDKIDLLKEDIYKAIADSKSVEEIASTVSTPTAEGAPAEEGKKDVSGTLRYCVDMTNLAAAGQFDPVIGREPEIQHLTQILLRRRKNSPILLGGAGVGKSAIVEGFAQAVVAGDIPKVLEGIKVMEVDMGALVAGAKYKGEFEERFKTLVSEVVKSGGKIVLFIDEIHTITGAGTGGGGMDAANLIKPALARGQLRLIGATTEEEYTKYIEKDKALERRFEKVKVEEPDYDNAVRIARGVMPKYAEHHKIEYSDEAIIGSVKYAQRYLSERNLPDIALDIIDEAASEYAVKKEFSEVKIPELDGQRTELEKLIQQCDGKDPEKDAEDFNKLRSAYEEFSRTVDRMHEFWGHRLETGSGGTE
ncbi:MAG: ATP-dependent Clp protease ATP-binding subunit [Candidatus Zixiibacteriota bacterium]|nr:MAG: ATP-dependent Clp protease ATP-binding subunit [candidate division Zixibacteria bacterium]